LEENIFNSIDTSPLQANPDIKPVSDPNVSLFENVEPVRKEDSIFSEIPPENSVPLGTPALPTKSLIVALSQVNNQSNPSLQMADDNLELAKQIIETGQEATLRNQIAAERAVTQLANLNKFRMQDQLLTPEQSKGIDEAYSNVLQWDKDEKAQIALEQQALENIQDMAARDPVQAKVLLDNLEKGGAEQVMRDNLIKMTILNQRAEELDADYNESGWGRAIINGILNLVPLNYNFQRSGIVEGADTGFMDWLLSGEGIRKQSGELWSMSPEDFAAYAAKDGPLMQSIRDNATTVFGATSDPSAARSILGELTAQTESDRKWADAWGAAEIAMILPYGKIGSVGKTLVRSGARKEAIDLMSKAAETMEREGVEAMVSKTSVTPEEFKAANSTSHVDPTANSDFSVPLAMDLATREEAARQAIEELPGVLRENQRLSPDELMQAYEDKVEQLSGELGRPIKDYKLVTENLATGNTVNAVEYVIGKQAGGGYASKQTATKAAESRGLTGEAFRDESGQWFVRGKAYINETGYYTNELHAPTQGFLNSLTGRWYRSAARISDSNLHGKSVSAGSSIQKQQKILGGMLDGVFKNIPKQSQEVVQQAALVGANKAKWWSEDEFNALVQRGYGRAATDKELETYKKLQLFNDMDWVLRNDQMFLEKATRGVENVNFTTRSGHNFNIEGVVNYNPKIKPSQRIYNVSDNVHYTSQLNPLTDAEFGRLADEGYVLVKTDNAVKLADGTTVDHVMMRRTDVEIAPLSRTQLAYSEGGHRLYTDQYFIKQASIGRQADTGTEYLQNPNVFATAKNVAEAKAWAETMEAARLAVKEGRITTGHELDEVIFKGDTGFPSGDEFLEGIANGSISKNHPFEAVYDREMPSAYQSPSENVSSFVNEDEVGFNGYYRTTGKLYTSSKGNILKDTKGQLATTVDPYEALSTSLRQVSRQSGLYNYKTESLERFINTFKDNLDIPSDATSNYAKFVNAKVKPGLSLTEKNVVEAQRAAIMNVLSFQTPFEMGMQQAWRGLAEQALGDGTNKARVLAHDSINWFKEKNPVAFLRGLAFDSKLGAWNAGQFVIQTATMASAIALSPKNGLKGWATAIPMHGYLLSKGSERVLDVLAKRGVGKLAGFKTEMEFKEYARSAYKSGFMDMDGTHVMVGENGPAAVYSSFGDKANRVRENSRMFFYAAETYNRLVAYRIAWEEAIESGLKPGMGGFNGKVAALADDYSLNMTRESAASWQKGLMSIPTQFWAYNVRMMDAMLGGRFTAAQKMRLVGVNLTLAGTAGIPVLPAITTMIKDNYGIDPDIASIEGTLDRGILDRLAYELNGADVNIGAKMGTGEWFTNTVKDLFGQGEYGAKPWTEVMGGASYSILKSAGETGLNLLKYTVAESGGDMGEDSLAQDEFLKLASEIATFNNITKAMIAADYGIYKSKSGTIYPDLPKTDSFYIALGFRPQEINSLGHMMRYNENKETAIKDGANQLKKWRQEAFFNKDMMEPNMKKANALIRLLPEDIRKDVIKKANSGDDSESLFTHVAEKYHKEKLEAEASARMMEQE
jgi:hypothetical protein